MNLRAVAQRVIEVAEVEVSSVIDLGSSHLKERRAARLHRSIESELLGVISVKQSPRSQLEALKAVQANLSKLLNRQSLKLLRQALRAFREGMAAKVLYVVNEGGSETAREKFALDASQLPFIRFHGDALGAAIRLRKIAPELQWMALKLAALIETLDQAEWTTEDEPPEKVLQRVALVRDELQRMQSQLPPDAVVNVREFVGSMAYGSIHAHALPIAMSLDATPNDVRHIADMYGKFGSELRQFVVGTLRGNASQRQQAKSAWARYQSLGQCLKIVAAWMRALALEEEHRICSICYRHVAALSRCGQHATRSHETRDARLGKRVRPGYLSRAAHLARLGPVRSSLTASVRPFGDAGPEMERAAVDAGVPDRLLKRSLVLGEQLRRLFYVFEPSRHVQVQKLFLDLVRTAVELTGQTTGRTLEELRRAQAASDLAYGMLSLKGFFTFWYGIGWFEPFGHRIQGLGFDKAHPAVRSALDPHRLPGHLLRQRAWEEAYLEFVEKFMPDRDDIVQLQRKGLTIAEIARHYNVPHQTIRYSMVLPRSARKRNRLTR